MLPMRYLWYWPADLLCAYNMLQHRQSFPRSWGLQLCDGLPARDAALSKYIYTKAEIAMDATTYTEAVFTQRRRIIATAAVCQFSTIVCSYRAKLWHKGEPLCTLHRKSALRLLKRHDGTRHDDFCVFSRCSPGVLLVMQTRWRFIITKLLLFGPVMMLPPEVYQSHSETVPPLHIWNFHKEDVENQCIPVGFLFQWAILCNHLLHCHMGASEVHPWSHSFFFFFCKCFRGKES